MSRRKLDTRVRMAYTPRDPTEKPKVRENPTLGDICAVVLCVMVVSFVWLDPWRNLKQGGTCWISV